jgi:hypothetical protein
MSINIYFIGPTVFTLSTDVAGGSVPWRDTTITGVPHFTDDWTCFTFGRLYRILGTCLAVSIGLMSGRRNPNLCLAGGIGTRNVGLASVAMDGDGGIKFDVTLLLIRDIGRASEETSSKDREVGQHRARRRAIRRPSNASSTEPSALIGRLKAESDRWAIAQFSSSVAK